MKMDLSRYHDPEEQRVQKEVQSIKDGRRSLYGSIANESFKTLDKKHYSIIADATLDEIIETINHLFLHYPLCDTCEEPATRVADIKCEDRLTKPFEYSCDCCRFSTGSRNIRPTITAESVHRAKAIISKLQNRI